MTQPHAKEASDPATSPITSHTRRVQSPQSLHPNAHIQTRLNDDMSPPNPSFYHDNSDSESDSDSSSPSVIYVNPTARIPGHSSLVPPEALHAAETLLHLHPLKLDIQPTNKNDIKRSHSEASLPLFRALHARNSDRDVPSKKTYDMKLYHNDPRDWMPGYVPSSPPLSTHRHSSALKYLPSSPLMLNSSSDSLFLEGTAEYLGLDKPADVQKLMREKGISSWAAALAVGGTSTGNNTPVVLDSPEEHSSVAQTSHDPSSPPKSTPNKGLNVRNSRATSVGGNRKRPVSQRFQSIEISEEVSENENMKRDFILKLAKTFYQYGAPSHRFEHHLSQVAEALKMKAEFILLPALIMVSFGGDNFRSSTHFIKVSGGINMAKLAQVNALCLTLTQDLIDIENAVDLLEGVRVAKDYSPWIILLTYPVSSFTISFLLFQLSWLEASISGFIGLVIGFMCLASERFPSIVFLLEFLGSLIASFFAKSLQRVFHEYCFDYLKVTLGGISVLLPGLSLTIAIIELSTRNMVSGTVRLFGALFIAMLLGFGMTIGSTLVLWDITSPANPTTCAPTSPYWSALFFIPMSMSVNLLFQGNKHQWAIMTLASALGYASNTLLNLIPALKGQPNAVTALSAISIGLTGNIYSRITNDVAVAPILAGILLQVPGGLSVKGSLGLFAAASNGSSANIIDGIGFTFQMLSVAMSLSIGLFIATLLVWPIRGPKSKYLTF